MHGRSFFFAVLKNVASEKFKFSLSFQTQFATKKKNWSSPNVVYFEVEWLSKSTIYSVVWLVRKFSGVALCYKSNSICLSQKVCWFFLRDDFFWHFLAKNGKNGMECHIKTQVAIDKNVIKMKLKHKWFILAQDKGPLGYVCSYEQHAVRQKNFLYLALGSVCTLLGLCTRTAVPQMRKRVELLHSRRKSELPRLPYYSWKATSICL